MIPFVHLHNHSHYSLLDGFSTPLEIATIAKNHGQQSVALTDHGTMSGTLAFQKACQKIDIKAIQGVEAYYVPSLVADTNDKKAERFHLILLAKNDDGLNKLFQLQQKSWVNGFYYKPRVEWQDLEYLSGDVVCLSGCMASLVCRLLENGEYDQADSVVGEFKGLFKDDYYIELQPWNFDGLNGQLVSLAYHHNILLAGTIDCHYPRHADKGYEEALLMMGQMPSLNAAQDRYAKEHVIDAKREYNLIDKINTLYPDRRLRFDAHDNYVMSGDEVKDAFEKVGVSIDVYSATLEAADKCFSTIKTGRSLLPKFIEQFDSAYYLRELAEQGLKNKGLDTDPKYVERLNHELNIVSNLGFSDYFLIVWDVCAFADRQGIYRGPGRGSVAGSLLAFCLSISSVDPIRFELLFSRFINPDRVSWPDIDLDFEDKRREEIKKYIRERWGEDNVASISTFGEFKAKSVIKDAARIFQIPYSYMNKLTPKFESLDDIRKIPDGKKFMEEYPYIFPIAERIEGRIRTAGAHAGGVVVSSVPLWQVCPVESRTEKGDSGRLKVTAYNMDEVEELGLIKFDILGLKALAVIHDCLDKIKERHGIDAKQDSLNLDDSIVIDKFNTDSLIGIFQAEGAGYKNLIAEMGISSFSDIVASNALVRPGALVTQGAQYVACKKGKQEPTYPHEMLKPILEETFGSIVYQEQVMRMAVVLAGFTESEADTLRKIIGKKRDIAEFLPFKEKFVNNAAVHVGERKAEKLWVDLEKTALYQFNKSHAVAYSMLSYQTMWLKTHYPQEFIWACLTNEDKNESVAAFLVEAQRLGIDIVGPDINLSDESFRLDNSSIRFGLSNVMGAGPAAIKEILDKRPFVGFDEFRAKCKPAAVKKNLVENLEKVGAFQSIGHDAGYDTKKYYLSILSCPLYVDENPAFIDIISPLAEVDDDNGIHVVRGMVKTAKRKPNFFRIELEDSSGSQAFFSENKEADIKTKNYLLAIAGKKSLLAFDNAEDEDSKIVNFLLRKSKKEFDDLPEVGPYGSEKYQAVVISTRWFKTKAGKIMANSWVYEPISDQFHRVVIFASTYGKIVKYLNQWEEVVIRAGDKAEVVDNMISLQEYKEIYVRR